MKNKILMGLSAIVMIAVLVGCGKKPQVEIDTTNAAIEAAKTAEADVYLPDEFAAVQDSMNAILADIEAQEGKMFKNYGDATENLASVQALANELASKVDGKKEEVKAEAETLMNDIETVIAENNRLVARLPRGKEGVAVIEQIKADLSNVDASVAEAKTAYDSSAFMDAYNKLQAAKAKADELNAEMKEALTKARIRF